MTDEEAHAARTLWDELHAQHAKAGARNEWLADHPDLPDWPDLDARASRSDAKFGRLREELAAWADVDALAVCLLFERTTTWPAA